MANEKKKNKRVQEMEFSKEPAMNDVASELFSSRIIDDLEKSDIVPVDITDDIEEKLSKDAEELNAMVEDLISKKMVSAKSKKNVKQDDNAVKESKNKKSEDVAELRNLLTALKEQEDEDDQEEEPVVVASTVDTPVDDENDVVQSVVSVEEPADASDVDDDNSIDILMSIIGEFLDKIVSLEEPQEEPMGEPEEVEPEQETEPEVEPDIELEPEAGSEDEFDLEKTLSTIEHFMHQVEAAKTSVDKAMEKISKNFEDSDAEKKKDMEKTTEAEDADLDTVLKDIDKLLEDVSDEMPGEEKSNEKEEDTEAPDKEAEVIENQTESYVPLPIAVNATWSPVNSSKRILEAAVKTDTVDFELIKQAHLYVEPGKENDIDAYQYPIADIIDGKLYAIPGAIKTLTDVFANDATLKALKVNENVVKEVRQKLEKYLEQLGMLIPWKEAESQEGNLKFRESSGLLSIYSTYEEFDPAMVLRKLANDNE